MASRLEEDPVQLALTRGRHWYELTLVTLDRPFLFSKMAGTLAAWGMNIVKAAAFSNRAGIVVDTFFFTDRFRTLELNLPEWERFKTSIHDVLVGKADLDRMLSDRMRSEKNAIPKVKIETKIEIDDECFAAQHAGGSDHARPARASASHQFAVRPRKLQYRNRADRNRRPDGHRRLLPDLARGKTAPGEPGAASCGACCRNWPTE